MKQPVLRYTIVQDCSLHDFEAQINTYIQEGWELYGSPSTSMIKMREDLIWMHQALVLRKGYFNFREWWRNVGSGIILIPGDDFESHAKRVATATHLAITGKCDGDHAFSVPCPDKECWLND
jgi:hypothetical protein